MWSVENCWHGAYANVRQIARLPEQRCWQKRRNVGKLPTAPAVEQNVDFQYKAKDSFQPMFFARLPTHTREHQPERIVYMEMSPVEIEPTTYCLGERKSGRFRVPPGAYIFPNFNVFHHFRMFAFPPKTACFTLFVLAEC